MTTLSTRPVTRETLAFVFDRGHRPLIATLSGGVLELRPKRMHNRETISLAWCYEQAVKQRVARERAERKARRTGRRR